MNQTTMTYNLNWSDPTMSAWDLRVCDLGICELQDK